MEYNGFIFLCYFWAVLEKIPKNKTQLSNLSDLWRINFNIQFFNGPNHCVLRHAIRLKFDILEFGYYLDFII